VAEELKEITDESMFDLEDANQASAQRASVRTSRRFKVNTRRETQVVKEICEYLESLGCKPVKNHGSIYAQRGRPDIEVDVVFALLPFAVHFYIEVKASRDLEARPQQLHRIEEALSRGAVAFVAADAETVRDAIEMTRQRILAWFREGQEG